MPCTSALPLPTPTCIRILLAVCSAFAAQMDRTLDELYKPALEGGIYKLQNEIEATAYALKKQERKRDADAGAAADCCLLLVLCLQIQRQGR